MSDTESNIDYSEYEEYRTEYVNEYGHDSENECQFDYQKYIDQKYNENTITLNIFPSILLSILSNKKTNTINYDNPEIINTFNKSIVKSGFL